MKRTSKILIILSLLSATVYSQPFTQVTNPFPAMGRGAAAFADFDNDGDLDLVMAGQDNTYYPMAKMFGNIQGEFSEVTSGIRGLYNSALSVADYDHDGMLDIVITGQGLAGHATHLYRNIGALQFQLTDSTLYAAGADGDVAFGDYDNDGFADIVLSGNWSTKLYHNNGNGSFTEVEAGLPGLNSPSIAWGDCDNDGDQDLLMVGDNGSITSYVLTNDDGEFTPLNVQMEGALAGSARWGDHNLDGYLDIMITGKDYNLLAVSFIYNNNSDNTFSNSFAGLVGTALGPADWIDYDNDGDLDVMLAGQNSTCGTSYTRLYTNDGIGGYAEFPAGLAFADRSASAWGDYDNDGDSDLFLAGISNIPTRYLYRNDLLTAAYQPNTPPTVPVITDLYTWQDYAIINWARATDLQSPQMSLTYNLRVGSTPGGNDILSPNADAATGNRYMATYGNMGSNTFGIIRGLPAGTYYYGLQTIDQSYAASAFSEEQSFIILPTAVNDQQTDDPILNIRREGASLHVLTNIQGKATISLYSMTGVRLFNSSFTSGEITIPTDDISEGIYLVSILTAEGCFTRKIKL